MRTRYKRPLTALALVSALAFPAAALGRGGEDGARGERKKPRHVQVVSYNFKGTVTGKSEDGTVTVTILRSNHHGRTWHNQAVQLDLSSARIVVRDVNGDGERDAGDIVVGDGAKLQARLPRNATVPAAGEKLPVKKGIFRAPDSDADSDS